MPAFKILALFGCLVQVNAFSSFQDKIPNGNKIPHPCKQNTIWHGVGHLNQFGGGKRNPFGLDFKNAGFKWTKSLCQADSDNDGKTNGEELGDPGCIWSVGGPAPTGSAKSHPGVCEPVDSPKCKSQTWISCSGTKANCSGRTEPGVMTKTIRFPRWNVPAQETTYYCKTFELPHDQDYHIVATEPVLDNRKVIHHMILYGCNEDVTPEKKPFDCIMGSSRCKEMLATWTVGQEGKCAPPMAAARIGKSMHRYAQLQVHWTNDRKLSNLYDSSGIKLFYTPNLRKYDLGTLITGQLHLELPPGKSEIVAEGVCRAGCTKTMLDGYGPVNITKVGLHAHFLGKNLSLAQYRHGKFIRYLARDDVFSYNNPTAAHFNPPATLFPGDELRTTCIYDTKKRTTTTYYGDGTFDEMCFAFVSYYPKMNTSRRNLCLSYERYPFCDWLIHRNLTFYKHGFGTCYFKEFSENNIPNVLRSCEPHKKTCSKDCKFYIDKMNAHRCMKGFERNMYNGLMWKNNTKIATTVFQARSLCAKSVVPAVATFVQPFTILAGFMALVVAYFYDA